MINDRKFSGIVHQKLFCDLQRYRIRYAIDLMIINQSQTNLIKFFLNQTCFKKQHTQFLIQKIIWARRLFYSEEASLSGMLESPPINHLSQEYTGGPTL